MFLQFIFEWIFFGFSFDHTLYGTSLVGDIYCDQYLHWIGGILGLMLVNLMATQDVFWVVLINLRGLFALSPVERIFLSTFMKDLPLDLSNLAGMVWETQWRCSLLFYMFVCLLLSLDIDLFCCIHALILFFSFYRRI